MKDSRASIAENQQGRSIQGVAKSRNATLNYTQVGQARRVGRCEYAFYVWQPVSLAAWHPEGADIDDGSMEAGARRGWLAGSGCRPVFASGEPETVERGVDGYDGTRIVGAPVVI